MGTSLSFIWFIFYPSIQIDWHFKDLKSPLNDKCVTYYSSHYRPYVEKYEKFLGKVDFTYTPNASKKKEKWSDLHSSCQKEEALFLMGKLVAIFLILLSILIMVKKSFSCQDLLSIFLVKKQS